MTAHPAAPPSASARRRTRASRRRWWPMPPHPASLQPSPNRAPGNLGDRPGVAGRCRQPGGPGSSFQPGVDIELPRGVRGQNVTEFGGIHCPLHHGKQVPLDVNAVSISFPFDPTACRAWLGPRDSKHTEVRRELQPRLTGSWRRVTPAFAPASSEHQPEPWALPGSPYPRNLARAWLASHPGLRRALSAGAMAERYHVAELIVGHPNWTIRPVGWLGSAWTR